MKNKFSLLLIIAIVLIVIMGIVSLYFFRQVKVKEAEMNEMVEVMNFEKEQVEREFEELNYEFDGYTSNIKNDSIFKLLDKEKARVQQLLEELRITKVTNARRIAELRKELATVRGVMVHYVNQIDSLNKENKVLKTENVEVRRRYQEVSQTAQQLAKEKDNLTEVVTRAAKMEVVNFSMTPLNNRNRKTTWFSQVANLQFNFIIAKNITAAPGSKTVYLRLMRPDNELLLKNPNNTFAFENRNIQYSIKKDVEYEGENVADVMYWKVEEVLPKGSYRADFFIDGNRVGVFNFEIK